MGNYNVFGDKRSHFSCNNSSWFTLTTLSAQTSVTQNQACFFHGKVVPIDVTFVKANSTSQPHRSIMQIIVARYTKERELQYLKVQPRVMVAILIPY